MSQPRTGGCLCRQIRYETVGDPVFALRCHCRDCQRQSGAAHVPTARVPSAGFRILQGTPRRCATKVRPEADIFMPSAQPWDHDETGVRKYDGYPTGKPQAEAHEEARQRGAEDATVKEFAKSYNVGVARSQGWHDRAC